MNTFFVLSRHKCLLRLGARSFLMFSSVNKHITYVLWLENFRISALAVSTLTAQVFLHGRTIHGHSVSAQIFLQIVIFAALN